MTGSLDSYFRNLSNIAGACHSIDVFIQFILVFLEKPSNHIEFSELRRLSMQKPRGVHPIVADTGSPAPPEKGSFYRRQGKGSL